MLIVGLLMPPVDVLMMRRHQPAWHVALSRHVASHSLTHVHTHTIAQCPDHY